MNAPVRSNANIRLSADVGGTFTDVAAFDEKTGELRLGKTLTTPERLVSGIENGVGKAGTEFAAARLFLHGTTVAINTILESAAARAVRCSPRRASATSTRSAASTGRRRITLVSASTRL